MLHIAAERTGAKLGIVGFVYDEGLGGLGEAANNLLVRQTLIELVDLQVDDLGDVVLGQGLVEDDFIQPVQELGTEGPMQQSHDPLFGVLGDFAVRLDAAQQLLRA